MAIFKPTNATGTPSDYLGFKMCSIKTWKETSADWSWSDVFLTAELDVEGTEYDQTLDIKGSFERDNAGLINGGAVLKRMYHLFEMLGCTAGISKAGKWEDEDGGEITDIADYMNQRFSTFNPDKPNDYSHIIYIYKKPTSKPGVNKAYTTVHTRMYPNTTKGKADLESHIGWMKGKGFLKEWTGEESTDASVLVDNL